MPREQRANIWTDSKMMGSLDYQIYHYESKDFRNISLHSHDFYEIYFFIKGDATYIIENNRYALEPGDILLVPPNSLHQLYIQDSARTYERYVLWIHPSYMASLSTENTDLATCFDDSRERADYLIRDEQLSKQIMTSMQELLTHEYNDSYGSDILARIRISTILLSLSTHVLSSMDNNAGNYKGKIQNSRIEDILDYVDSHLSDDLSLEEISHHMFISKYYLTRLFKEETGTTLHQYIVKRRLVYAKELIASNMPIVEVYVKAGFADYSHFFRAFKHEYGITPKEYYSMI